jgi:hypothetical protein
MGLRHLLGTGLLAGGAAAAVIAAFAAPPVGAAAPAARFAGTYAVTFRVTNAHVAASHWIFAPVSPCAARCRTVDFRERLTTETSWRRTVLHYTLRTDGYRARRVLPRVAACSTPAGKSVALGYDVVSAQTIRVTRTVDGVAVAFTGDGRDSYVPNAAGKAAGCTPGAYTFAIVGKRR